MDRLGKQYPESDAGRFMSVTPMRDMLGAVFTGVVELPGFDTENSGWLRDAYDHMIRISDLVDSYRDLLTGAMDVYLSTVSNRLNSVMKQLTVIATVFLPLTFVTGFFGQNFLYLTGHIQRSWSFWVFGIGIPFFILYQIIDAVRTAKAFQAGQPAPDPMGLGQAFSMGEKFDSGKVPVGAVVPLGGMVAVNVTELP